MYLKFSFNLLMAHRHENNLDSFAASKLHSRDKIAITSHKNQTINNRLAGKPCHIQSNFHINTLLRQVWCKVVFCNTTFR